MADSWKFERTRKSHGKTRLWVRVSTALSLVLSSSAYVSMKQLDYDLEISIA